MTDPFDIWVVRLAALVTIVALPTALIGLWAFWREMRQQPRLLIGFQKVGDPVGSDSVQPHWDASRGISDEVPMKFICINRGRASAHNLELFIKFAPPLSNAHLRALSGGTGSFSTDPEGNVHYFEAVDRLHPGTRVGAQIGISLPADAKSPIPIGFWVHMEDRPTVSRELQLTFTSPARPAGASQPDPA